MPDAKIFLSFEGVTGEQDLPDSHVSSGPGKGWAALTACRFSAEANVQARAMSRGASSRVDFGGDATPVEISKLTDGATAGLLREMLLPKAPRQAVVAFVRTDVDAPTEYLRYELDGCRIVGFDIASGGERALETYKLVYTKMTLIAFAGGHGAKAARSSVDLLNGI